MNTADWKCACAALADSLLENLTRTANGKDSMLRSLGFAESDRFKLDAETIRAIQEARQRIIDAIEAGKVVRPSKSDSKGDAWKQDRDYKRFRAVMLMEAPYPDRETFRRAAQAQIYRNMTQRPRGD